MFLFEKILESRFDYCLITKMGEEKKKYFFFEKCSSIPTTFLNLFLFYLPGVSFSGEFYFNHSCILFYTFLENLIGNHVKTILIWYSYLRKYFTIKKHLTFVQIVYEYTITIGYLILTSYRIYTSDPQTTKIPLLSASIAMRGN